MDKENLKPKRRRKSYRRSYDRRKNDVRKHQANSKLSHESSAITTPPVGWSFLSEVVSCLEF